jgi:predicted  nucleic acid-binding Zn-ribbon protein
MQISTESLRLLHRLHRQVADLKERVARGPQQVQIGQQTVQHSEQELADAKEALKRTRLESDGQQLHLKEREAKIKDLQRKLNECKTNVEFKALRDQIAAENKANSVLEDEILDKLEKIEQQQHLVAEATAKLATATAELRKTQQRVEEAQSHLQADLDRVSAELKQAEAAVPEELRAEYERMVRAKGEDALAAVEGESCGVCNTMLTTQIIHQLKMSQPVFCKICGSLMYLPESHPGD